VSRLLENLNPQQKNVVETTEGAILVLAGAGSGKTKALTHKLAFLLEQGLAAPNEVLAVTFTNKAAREMESRVYELLRQVNYCLDELLTLSTFHSFGARILRRHAEELGYSNQFTIYDENDQNLMIKKVLKELNVSDAYMDSKQAQRWINYRKSDAKDGNFQVGFGPRGQLFEEIFTAYEKAMLQTNAMDFSDLLYKTYKLFTQEPRILEMYSEAFRYIMVDEYQDTNYLQYQLIRLLSSKHKNVCVVGDEDQSIYSWRGADISNILNFERDFPDSKIIRLEQNYRSTKNIVEAASHMIRNNISRKGKELFTENASGELIHFQIEPTDFDEARWVARKIESSVRDQNVALSDIAILYRTNAQSRLFEEQLRQRQIPYRIIGGLRFFDRAEVKDALSYLRLIYNPKDDIALRRIINVPTRGIGKTTLDKLADISQIQGLSMWESCYYAIENKLFPTGTLNKLKDFLRILEKLSERQSEMSLLDYYRYILEQSGYLKSLELEATDESRARIQNLEELANAIEQFEKESSDRTLQSFLEEMALVSDLDQVDLSKPAVTLMTVHMAKGLEFSYVYVVGMEEGLFPSGRGEVKLDDLEEERRLFYVAMTRAKKELVLTAARQRKVWGQEQSNPVARFIAEIPQCYLKSNLREKRIPSFVARFENERNIISEYDDRSAFENFNFHKASSQSYYDRDDYAQQSPDICEGMRVKHPNFGAGIIRSIEGEGDMMKLTVLFEGQSIKKFIAKYAKLEYLG